MTGVDFTYKARLEVNCSTGAFIFSRFKNATFFVIRFSVRVAGAAAVLD